jgi:hypothetical protein
MSILKTNLDEEILTKQERSLLRHLYRLAQIGQGISEITKLIEVIDEQLPHRGNTHTTQELMKYRDYMSQLLDQAVSSYRVPGTKSDGDKPSDSGSLSTNK